MYDLFEDHPNITKSPRILFDDEDKEKKRLEIENLLISTSSDV
jgi:hypothetical protein